MVSQLCDRGNLLEQKQDNVIQPPPATPHKAVKNIFKTTNYIMDIMDALILFVALTVLEEDGFGPNPFFRCLVVDDPASDGKRIVGYTLFYFTYSTWEGRSVYMEDIYVTPDFRGQGIGKLLWKACVQVTFTS